MRRSLLGILLALGIILPAACSKAIPASLLPTQGPSGTPTPDPCSAENLQSSVKPANDLLREFDDYATLATNVVQSELVKVIPHMQAVRRAAQDLVVPGCMEELKRLELAYMDTTLQTLLAFQKPNPNTGTIATGIQRARDYHDQYIIELARLLGVTLTPFVTTPVATATP